MAQPLPYERDFDFEFFQSQHPVTPLPGDKVNLELDQVAETFDQVLDRIRRLQRDDLALANKSVGYDQLKDEVSLGFNPPTAWETGVAYVRSDSVFADNGFYRCLVSHTSGDFEADLAVGKWELVADFTSATTEAQAAQAAAEAARDAAIAAKNGAESARDTAVSASAAAGTYASNAALSAGTATSAAGTATGARDAALGAQSGAESARDAAVNAKNDAEAAAVAADASADAAAVSEANAAATLAGALVKTNNLSDVADAATSRENLGVEAATRTILKAMPAAPTGRIVHLLESGREGKFRLKAGSIPVTDTYEGWFIASNTASFYWERISDFVCCDEFGPAADGATNDEAVLNSAAVVAAYLKKTLILSRVPGRTYAVANSWDIVNGVPAVLHGGGTIKLTNSSGFGGVYLRGIMSGKAANVKDCIVSLRVDANSKQAKAIIGENCSRVTFRDCYVWNADVNGYGIAIWASPSGGEHAVDNKIVNNTIFAGTAAPTETSNGIFLIADNGLLSGTDTPDAWKANKAIPSATWRILRTVVANNNIFGGHYAIGLFGAEGSAIVGNTCTSNIRSISMQSQSNDNTVVGNTCKDFFSSCIHIAYQSHRNLVANNNGISSRAQVEGLLQAYVGSTHNRFLNNNMLITAGSGPRYFIYCAIHANHNVYQGNTLNGPCQKAYIAIESGWEVSPTDSAQRPGVADGPDWANAGTSLVTIAENTIISASAVPLIFLGQVSTNALVQCTIQGNKLVRSDVTKFLHMMEQNSGSSVNHTFTGNTWTTGIGVSHFTFPRGRAHFADISGRLFTDGQDVIVFAASDLTPSVVVGRVFQVDASGTGSITMFDDGKDGQEITVRLAANSNGITHNNSNIRLKGGSNIATVDSNSWIHLRRLGGIWFETGRSF